MSEITEAIILCGKDSWKPVLDFGKFNLLELQISWLVTNGFKHIILAANKEYPVKSKFNNFIEWSIEYYPKGTGGSTYTAIDKLEDTKFYLMNVDDICIYSNPLLLCIPETQARILVAKPKIDVGRVELRHDLVIGFKEKPIADYYVSCGHYFFKKHIIEKYFPDNGNLEDIALPRLARERILEHVKLSNKWMPINSDSDYKIAREIFYQ